MAEYIIRARKAPTDAARFLGAPGSEAHVEYLAQIVVNSLFVSKGHRSDTTVTLVLEDAKDYSKAISLEGDTLGSLHQLTEAGILSQIAECLRLSTNLNKEECIVLENGIKIQAISFEHLVKSRLESRSVYLLDKKAVDIRAVSLAEDAVFLLTDHIPMPRKTFKSLNRQGVQNISLGPVMLHASQCVVLIQNEYDRNT
ncbi:MAG: tRNA (pseudouridine54-N1)-methyltransferase [Flavobacterium sp.]|jgi:tRNA (pseudouridine54-N1)-methyltransferase